MSNTAINAAYRLERLSDAKARLQTARGLLQQAMVTLVSNNKEEEERTMELFMTLNHWEDIAREKITQNENLISEVTDA